MPRQSSCIFLSFLPLSLSLSLAAIHSCDAPANEILASSVGTSFHQWQGYRAREGGREKERRLGTEVERMLFGAADSTITPHSATIGTWLLWACLEIKERWITCMSLHAGYCTHFGLCAIVLVCHVRLRGTFKVCVRREMKYSPKKKKKTIPRVFFSFFSLSPCQPLRCPHERIKTRG